MRDMVGAGQQPAEELAVVDHAADRDAAEADAMIASLAPDQPRPGAVAAHVVIGERDLEGGIDRLRTRIAEEHMVEIGRRQRSQAAGELERLGMGELKRRRIIELGGLGLDRRDDRVAIVPGIGHGLHVLAVEHGAAFGRVVVHVLGAHDQPGRSLERAICCEWQPIRLEVVGHSRHGAGRFGALHGKFSFAKVQIQLWAFQISEFQIFSEFQIRNWPGRSRRFRCLFPVGASTSRELHQVGCARKLSPAQ